MSKSIRERNYRKEEAKYSDGPKRQVRTGNEKIEKRIKNLFRSGNTEQFLEQETYK